MYQRPVFVIIKRTEPTGEVFGGLPVWKSEKTGEKFLHESKARKRVEELNAAVGSPEFRYQRN